LGDPRSISLRRAGDIALLRVLDGLQAEVADLLQSDLVYYVDVDDCAFQDVQRKVVGEEREAVLANEPILATWSKEVGVVIVAFEGQSLARASREQMLNIE
jgi:hypothetical protein